MNIHTPMETAEKVVDKVASVLAGSAAPKDPLHPAHAAARVDMAKAPDGSQAYMTTDTGVRITRDDYEFSQRAGMRGPTLLEDFILRQKIMHNDHERIPERVVHARGSAAHGYFQVYDSSMSEYTCAKVLTDPSLKTPVFTRFSPVFTHRGSADTNRQTIGFAVKFYTQQGIWDLVGNNMPVFAIFDASSFPDLVHAGMESQDSAINMATTAHDEFYDFVSLKPESMHHVLWTLSGHGIPRSYRMMRGFAVHTFRLVTEDGKGTFVKFQWIPVMGPKALCWDEAKMLCGADPDFHRRDLWEAIDAGTYVEYELAVQLIPEADEFKFDFDLLDPTKLIPEELVPLKKVGRMVLNRNPDNFFAETEQVAYCPANIVPGIDFTNDPLLQGRLFAYLDTQITRLGGPNFNQIPINRPINPVINTDRDGFHQHRIPRGRLAQFPNSIGGGNPALASVQQGAFVHYTQKVEGHVIKTRSPSFADYYTHAAMFWHSLAPIEQDHVVLAATFELQRVEAMEVRQRMVDHFARIDFQLSTRVAEAIGAKPPTQDIGARPKYLAHEVSIEKTMNRTSIRSSKIAILCASGVDGVQYYECVRRMQHSEGGVCEIVAPYAGMITTLGKEQLRVAKTLLTASGAMYDSVYIPGGPDSVRSLMLADEAYRFVEDMYRQGKPICASNEGVDFLANTRVAKNVKLTDSHLLEDKGVVTTRHVMQDRSAFLDACVNAGKRCRFWDVRKGDTMF